LELLVRAVRPAACLLQTLHGKRQEPASGLGGESVARERLQIKHARVGRGRVAVYQLGPDGFGPLSLAEEEVGRADTCDDVRGVRRLLVGYRQVFERRARVALREIPAREFRVRGR